MTVTKTSFEEKYVGLSSDIKPSDAEENAIFHVIDTGDQYVFHDGTWEDDLRLIKALRMV
jgi:hypothetical protein